MHSFKRVSIKKKLTWIIMLTSSVALLLACVSFATYEVISLRHSMPSDLSVLARITGDNGRSALEFDDPKFAEETLLASLAAQPHIMIACLYRQDGKVFAKFQRRDLPTNTPIPAVQAPGHQFARGNLGLFHPVMSNAKQIGTVYLQSDLDALYSSIRTYLWIGSVVLLASLLVAWLLTSGFQRVISGPILKLAETAASVAREKNYSVRVTKQTDDELGTLFDGFNEMLSEIEQRDAALQQAHRDLEKRVDERTAALRVSQEKIEALVNSIDGLVWEADPHTFQFTFVSQQAEALLGYPREQWTNDPGFWQEHLFPEDRQRAMDFFRQATAQSKPLHFEYRMVAADGRLVWIRDSATVVLEGGNPILLRGVLQDVTEQKIAEQELENLNKQLLETSRQAGMAEVATGVLHNVGNVLNSVNVSATLVCDRVRQSKLPSLRRTAALLREREADLGAFMTHDPKGRLVPSFLGTLADHLHGEQAEILRELESLTKNIEHIKDIVAMQQSYARVFGLVETMKVSDLLEDALQFNAAALGRHGIEIVREYEEVPLIAVDKHKVLQILINLMQNAKYAMEKNGQRDKRLLLKIASAGPDRVQIIVRDNGMGIPAENLLKIFSHGFTTRKDGHGFGLHSGALVAKEMGGSLAADSEGPGQGALFTLELPLQHKQGEALAA